MTDHRPAGLLLFAHGARDPNWALPFQAVASQCRTARGELGEAPGSVRLAFLEFMAPNLLQAGAELVAHGCRDVVVVPLFLGAGGHVRKDLPTLMAQLSAAHPQVQFHLQPAVGESDAVVAAMADVALAACSPNSTLVTTPATTPATTPTAEPGAAA